MSHTENSSEKKYEVRDAKIRSIVISAIALVSIIVVAFVAVTLLFDSYDERHTSDAKPASPFTAERPLPPGPRLQVNPEHDLEKFLAQQASLVNSYGWVMEEVGVVRIPVDEAMKIMLERGFPARRN